MLRAWSILIWGVNTCTGNYPPCYLGDLILLCNIIPNMFDVIYSTCHALIIIIAGVLDLIMHNYCEKYHIFNNWAHYDVIISKLTTMGRFLVYIIIDYHIKISCMQFHIKMIRNKDFIALYSWHIHDGYFTILIERCSYISIIGSILLTLPWLYYSLYFIVLAGMYSP